MCTMISRLGLRSTRHNPSSRFNLRAARSKRAACACHGLVSCSRSIVFINSPNDGYLLVPIERRAVSEQTLESILRPIHLGKLGCRLLRGGAVRRHYMPHGVLFHCIFSAMVIVYPSTSSNANSLMP